MRQAITLFVSTSTTLLAIVNPLEILPIFLRLLEGRDDQAHREVARRSCLYATVLMFFFLLFGTIILRLFGVPLSMVRVVGGIILMRIGFDLFLSADPSVPHAAGRKVEEGDDVAFVPLAMPIMFGPGALATILGMTSLVKHSEAEIVSFLAISAAIVVTMLLTYLCLAFARQLLGRLGPKGIDAVTRIVGFFLSAIGMGLIFHGVVEALRDYGLLAAAG
jgi:multiple antibiotic resistance protein